jgi:D-alanyl-D-alanine carboxypeptidase
MDVGALFGIVVTAAILAILYFALTNYIKLRDKKKTVDDVLRYLEEHPDQVSLLIREDHIDIVNYQSNQVQPLTSVVNIIIATEYARQVGEGYVQPEKMVPLAEIEKYYIPEIDKAHAEWLRKLEQEGRIQQQHVQLQDVARGMVTYSSYASTEYLIALLGLEQINATLQSLALKNHDELYYYTTSAMLLPAFLRIKEKIEGRQLERRVKRMSYQEYKELAGQIHQMLEQGNASQILDHLNPKKDFAFSLKIIWAKRLPKASAQDYADLLRRIYQEGYLQPNALMILQALLRADHPDYSMVGSKQGEDLSISNLAMYYQNHRGSLGEICFFIHDPSCLSIEWLRKNKMEFLNKISNDESFRNRVIKQLHKQNLSNESTLF